MLFWKKKKKIAPEPELSKDDIIEIINENIKYAKIYSNDGNVSGMEMSIEIAIKYSNQLGQMLDSDDIAKIKLIGYERGEKLMRKKANEFRAEGKINQADNAEILADNYASEALMLRQTI